MIDLWYNGIMKISIKRLTRAKDGRINVHFYKFGEYSYDFVVENVSYNLVRCAIGNNDTEYLLKYSHIEQPVGCFSITKSEFDDFLRGSY
jgi:hypothetical protein